jgi:hypothetical protein
VWGAIQLALSIHHRDDLPTQALVMERARGWMGQKTLVKYEVR